MRAGNAERESKSCPRRETGHMRTQIDIGPAGAMKGEDRHPGCERHKHRSPAMRMDRAVDDPNGATGQQSDSGENCGGGAQ